MPRRYVVSVPAQKAAPVTGTQLYLLWPMALSTGALLFALAMVVPESAAVLVLRWLSVVAFLAAVVCTIPGIA
jgi:hypothetical protein